ncbi:phosphatidylinositol phosphate synthase [Nesterenkonia marinintestina]|uniref:phosphatidylinositol phosphate synthase n=1 Tax=Nesterenkonia marinintestina TaxID=2979865 RepID=UPI0021BFB85E|nr:CDP-alcohol phosphatidyltransferase family protein [Nesterenkonia sp. GX14115]
MLNRYARGLFTALFAPLARLLLRWGVTPNAVTVVGALGVSLGALVLYPLGELFWGTVWITLFVFSDLVDGLMARIADVRSEWGGFLDSTADRVQDGAVFLGLLTWFLVDGQHLWVGYAAGLCMLLGGLVPYVRAKAEAMGLRADVGLAERPERMVATLVFTGFTGLGLPVVVLGVVLWLLAAASLITVVQRIVMVRRQIPAR